MKPTDNYCDYQTSLLLKEVGFNEPCDSFYFVYRTKNKDFVAICYEYIKNETLAEFLCTRPTWLEALEWLEKQGFKFELARHDIYILWVINDKIGDLIKNTDYPSIISAIQTAVKEAVRILKEQKLKNCIKPDMVCEINADHEICAIWENLGGDCKGCKHLR